MTITVDPVSPFPSWTTYDPVLKQWFPPIPYPTDGGQYVWDEEVGGWVLEVIGE